MAYCPSCGAVIAADAASCPSCNAVFGEGSAWSPLEGPPVEPPPSRATRIVTVVLKVVLATLSLAALAFGLLWSISEKGQTWTYVQIAAIVVVVIVAIKARLRWSFLLVFASMALGLASCFANFKWHGG